MPVIDKLSSSLNHRDELPNKQLAAHIVNKNDAKAIKELVDDLNNKNKDVQNDSIKVLYEIGERKPSLIAHYAKDFISLLDNKNNRLQWGAMTAIDAITSENPEAVYKSLSKIILSSEKGSVITKDHAVSISIKLCSIKKFSKDAFMLLIEELQNSLTNQLPVYAEKAMAVINDDNKNIFIRTLTLRLDEIEKETKRKRVEKVIKKLLG
jgi:hypothetical protein